MAEPSHAWDRCAGDESVDYVLSLEAPRVALR
jgi:hypothetical protein